MKGKKVQVSERFYDTAKQLVEEVDPLSCTAGVYRLLTILRDEIQAKAAAAARREKFTAYKTAAPGDERDAKRIDYLVEAGLGRTSRSEKEARNQEPPE